MNKFENIQRGLAFNPIVKNLQNVTGV